MAKIPGKLIYIIVALMLCCGTGYAKSAEKLLLIPITSGDKASAKVAEKVTKALATHLKKNKNQPFAVAGGQPAVKMRQCLQLPACAISLGKRYQASFIVAGHIDKMGNAFHMEMQAASAKKGSVLASEGADIAQGENPDADSVRALRELLAKARAAKSGDGAALAVGGDDEARGKFSRSDAEASAFMTESKDEEDPNADPETKRKAKLAKQPGANTTQAAPPPKPIKHEILSPRYRHVWWTTGAGMAILGAGLTFGIISNNAQSDARDAEYQADAWTQLDKARKNATVANVLYGVGSAAIVTSAVLFYFEYRKETKEQMFSKLRLGIDIARGGTGLVIAGAF